MMKRFNRLVALFLATLMMAIAGVLTFPNWKAPESPAPTALALESLDSGTSTVSPVASTLPAAPLLDTLGTHSFPISTANPLTQRYFNQGLILTYGFNHAEAIRSFQSAVALDPTCAMCHWGMAYALGPNINAAMEDTAIPTAYEAIQRAIALRDHASPREWAYIQALARRYSPDGGDRAELDRAYADAMGRLARRYPSDLEAATLYAEALMDTMPWNYWLEDGSPKPETVEILNTLESVLKRNPDHPGALHLYIHTVEKERPELGIEAADRLRDLVPGAGHLVHMPSHIYLRVGRYHDAVVANQKAVEADQDYVTRCHAQGLYPVAYMPHNYHFLEYAAVMAGERDVALDAAYHTAQMADPDLMRLPDYGTLQHYASIPLYAKVKFEQWNSLLAEPAPAADLVYPNGVWHFARGMAYAAKGRVHRAQRELDALLEISQSDALNGVTLWNINTTAHLLQIASEVLGGEIAAQMGDFERAIAHLETGVELEDQLNYDEPAPWYSPVRQNLGRVLLQAGQPVAAEQAYRADLAMYPDNGWSLYGLAQALTAQGNHTEAELVRDRLAQVWENADVTLSPV